MDKRGARIVFGCIAGTTIVILLIFLAARLTRPSCELVIIEQTQFRSAALANWYKEKPIRSHDKSTLFRISAYLEYNIQSSSKDKSSSSPSSQDPALSSVANHNTSFQAEQDILHPPIQPQQPQQQQQQQHQQQQQQQQLPVLPNPSNSAIQSQQSNQSPVQVPAQASSVPQQSSSSAGMTGKSPTPSLPQSGFSSQQLANSSLPFNITANGANGDSTKSEKPRFLPLELNDIEIKKIDDNKYSYKLGFNCTNMELILVKKPERIFVEKITMELKPKSQKKSSCEIQLATPETFATEVSAHDGWAHYYCDRPLKYSCYHNSSKHQGEPGILLAELHINFIEFETTGGQTTTNNNNKNSSIHKKNDFLGARGKFCT